MIESWEFTSVEDGIFSIVCVPKSLSLIQRPLRSGPGVDVGVVGIRHCSWKGFRLMLGSVTVGAVVVADDDDDAAVVVRFRMVVKDMADVYISFNLS
jgi:hypothetical protein